MHSKLNLLNSKEHLGLRLKKTDSYHFAKKLMTVAVVYTEMADIAREYPLIFLKDQPVPHALLGFEKEVNAYVSPNGEWLAQYLPGRIRAYPFSLVQNPKSPGQYGVAVDMDSEFISATQGEPLFSQNSPTETLSRYMKLLEDMQKAEPVTRSMVQVIRETGLLIDRAIRIKRRDQEDTQLGGIQVVDEKKLNHMPHEQFNRLRDNGVLPLIYAHLLSMANLRRGPLKGYAPIRPKDEDPGFKLTDEGLDIDWDKF